MKKPRSRSIEKLAEAAFEQAAEVVVERAKRTGTNLILWKDGAVREVSPFDARVGLKSKKKARSSKSK